MTGKMDWEQANRRDKVRDQPPHVEMSEDDWLFVLSYDGSPKIRSIRERIFAAGSLTSALPSDNEVRYITAVRARSGWTPPPAPCTSERAPREPRAPRAPRNRAPRPPRN